MSLISISNLTFTYEGSYEPVFEDVSFQIDTDWKLGFTGRNGRGKTTFLNLLMGKYKYSGTISACEPFDYFPFAVPDKSLPTTEVFEQICPDVPFWELQRECSLLEVPEDVFARAFDTLSNGEQTKILLASLFLREHHFLLIDEPTNHLDSRSRTLVSKYLASKKGFILVSHDRTFLDNCVDHILSINKTNIEIQKGNFSSWHHNKQLEDQFELAENDKLQKQVKKLSAAAKQTASWSDKTEQTKYGTYNSGLRPDTGFIGHKAAKMMKRSKTIQARKEKAFSEKSKLLKNLETADTLSIKPLVYHANQMVSLSDVSIFYGEKQACGGVRFEVHSGDRIALTGKNGCGKSSILKLIMGGALSYTGNLLIGSNLRISYVSQDTSYLCGNLRDFSEIHHIDESLFKAILRKLDFSRTQFEKDTRQFSEGQKKKVLIAKSLCEQAHLYIWDEPLNFIDILSRMQIENLIAECKPTMLFVEHDQSFVDAVATKIVTL